MWAAAGFRMELNAEGWNVCVGNAFAGVIVYIYKTEAGKFWQA